MEGIELIFHGLQKLWKGGGAVQRWNYYRDRWSNGTNSTLSVSATFGREILSTSTFSEHLSLKGCDRFVSCIRIWLGSHKYDSYRFADDLDYFHARVTDSRHRFLVSEVMVALWSKPLREI